MTLTQFKNLDSLRFSCIGYHPLTFSVVDFFEMENNGSDTIFLAKTMTSLDEVIILDRRLK